MTDPMIMTLPETAFSTSLLSDTALLDIVQRQTLRYFWDFAHPVSGMARERSSGQTSYDVHETVTTGGTGFGIMALIAGVERGWISRDALAARLRQICTFLIASPRYQGAFPHWLDGTTGQTIAFSEHDDGGDIVETAFLMMGLLCARQYFRNSHPGLAQMIDEMWRAVNWAGFCPEPAKMMWHWRPATNSEDRNHWAQDLPIRGWHEALIAFVLGAASPTHPIDPAAYQIGWKNSPSYRNGGDFAGIPLPLGPDWGGPLFFSHYSFLGLDPRGLTEDGTEYWSQNCNHTRINHAHCQANPGGFAGYGAAWGLTACDCAIGYDAFSPTNDLGTIAPTAALSAMPYTPELSLAALRHYWADYGGRLWGPFGFYDAFNETTGWVATSNLAIDQGPIVVMIENYRTGLLWRLFMSVPELAPGLTRLGFTRNSSSAQV